MRGLFSKSSKSPKVNDPIVVSYLDSVLRVSDVETLEDNRWFTDAVISFFYAHLKNSTTDTSHLPIVLLEPSIVHLLRQTPRPETLQGVLPSSLNSAYFAFLPINDHFNHTAGGNHWSLLVYSSPDASFFYYDSLRNTNYHHAKHAANCFMAYLRLPPCTIRVMASPQQTNSNDCGVYVLSLSEVLFHSLVSSFSTKTSTNPSSHFPPSYIWTIQENSFYPPSVQRRRIKGLVNGVKKTSKRRG